MALARALAAEPSMLLLDEPLSALDARTRAAATRELATTLAGLEVPAVLVTHDFESAAGVGRRGGGARRRAASSSGGAPQSWPPRRPARSSPNLTGAVLLAGHARADGGVTVVELDGGGEAAATASGSGRVAIALHPWEITLAPPDAAGPTSARNRLPARVVSLTRIGNRVRVGLDAGQPLAAELTEAAVAELGLVAGSPVLAGWKATAARLIPLADRPGSPPRGA